MGLKLLLAVSSWTNTLHKQTLARLKGLSSQIRRLLLGSGSARAALGVPQHELLCSGELLADGELQRPRKPAAVAGPHSAGQRGPGREGEGGGGVRTNSTKL